MKDRDKLFWIFYNNYFLDEEIKIEEFGRHVNPPDYFFSEKRSNNIIQVVLNGTCAFTVKTDNREIKHTLKAGDGFIVKGGIEHSYLSDKKEPCTRVWLAFSANSDLIMSNLGVDNGYAVFSGIDVNKCDNVFKKLYTFTSSSFGCYLNILSLSYKLLGMIERLGKTKNLQESAPTRYDPQNVVRFAVKYIDEHYKENISVTKLSGMFGYERSWFYKIFKKQYGITVQDYIIHKRISVARSMCVETDLPFLVIANSVGYANYVSFYKTFTKIVHVSPEQYRLKCRKNIK